MPESLTIVQETKEKSTVGRRFTVELLGYLLADSLWDGGGKGSESRPVFIVYLGSPQESQAFTANFRGGHPAKTASKRFRILKSHPHRWTTQATASGDVLTVAYVPDLFHLDPVDPSPRSLRFVFAPTRWWLETQAPHFGDFGDPYEAARAALFSAYLDRRTSLPVLSDTRFHLRLYRAALKTSWMTCVGTFDGDLEGSGYAHCHLVDPYAVNVSASDFQDFLVEQTQLHFEHLEENPLPWHASDPVRSPATIRHPSTFYPALPRSWSRLMTAARL